MAFCRNCGKEIDETNKFCPYCGADATIPKTEPKIDVDSILNTPEEAVDPQDAEGNKVMAVLAYLGILVLIPILAAPKSPFARFHSNQGLVLMISEFVLGIIIGIAGTVFTLIGLGLISSLMSAALSIGSLVLMVIGIMNAVNGKAKELPVIGKFRILK